MNLTLLSLSVSALSSSPLLLPSMSYHFQSIRANQIHLNLFFQNFLSSYSNLKASLRNSIFIHFLNAPIKINNKIECIQFQKFEITQSIKKSEVCINSCQFINCKNSGSYTRGGAIRFECTNSSLTVHATTFDDCTSVSCGGAIFACGEEEYSFDSNSYMMTHKNMDTFNSHYCCYSRCSAQIYDTYDLSSMRYSGYGSAILVASDNIELNYSSSTECPNIDSEHAYGAQFDIKTKKVKSCFINATKGDSICSAAMEYRNAQSGFFSYQTIVDQMGAFITCFSSLEGSVTISTCNLVNNTLRYISSVDLCSLIYVMYKNVVVSDFVVLESKIDNSVDQSGKKAHFASSNSYDVTVTVENCKIDKSMSDSKYFTDIKTTNIIIEERPNTHSIHLLKLGDCVGVVEPPPIFETSFFSKTSYFSQSEKFTSSKYFTMTNDLTMSKPFSSSQKFEDSNIFSRSNFFNKSSKIFSSTSKFTESVFFTYSNSFHSTVGSGDSAHKDKGSKAPLIGGIVGGAAGAAAVACGVTIFVRWKKASHIEIDIQEPSNASSSEVIIQNPLNRKSMDDDPFQNDFAEHLASLDTVL